MLIQMAHERGQLRSTWSRVSGLLLQKLQMFMSGEITFFLSSMSLVFNFPNRASHTMNSTFGGAMFFHTVDTRLSTSAPFGISLLALAVRSLMLNLLLLHHWMLSSECLVGYWC
uniref:Uncharacterized protein n=1 Tax=Opuntia streptacantha TaxID=393608 RepID=A0A7C8YBH8_OPUST